MKIFNFQPWQMKPARQNPKWPCFCWYCKESGSWKRGCHQFKHFRRPQPPSQPSQGLPHPMAGPEELQELSPVPPLCRLGETFQQVGINLSVLWTPELSANPAAMKWPLLQVIHSPDSGDFKPLRRFLSLNPCLFI